MSRRRGVAILLVLMSLMTATILTSAYVASRDNSGAIGANIAASAAARWSATSGLEMGVAILQTETDWRTAHTNGKLLDDYPLGGGTVDIDLVDMETNDPPTADTSKVQITATSTVDGVEQSSSAIAEIQVNDSTINVDLTEFTAFAADSLALENQATLTRWTSAPLSELGHPINMGTQATASGRVSIAFDAVAMDGMLYAPLAASGSLLNCASNVPIDISTTKDAIPMPLSPTPPLPTGIIGAAILLNGGTTTVSASTYRNSVDCKGGSTLVLDNGVVLTAATDITLAEGSKIVVNGDVTIIAKGSMLIRDNAAIELAPDAHLTLFVGEDLAVDDGYVGDSRITSARDNSGNASYIDPLQIEAYTWDGSPSTAREWRFDHNSVVKGSLYAPTGMIEVRDDSAVYGRVASRSLYVRDNGAIFYDPALDTGAGYTNPESPVFDASLNIKAEVKTIATLDDSALVNTSENLGLKVVNGKSTIIPVSLDPDVPPVVGVNDPTPRTVEVEVTMTSFGTPFEILEEKVRYVAPTELQDLGLTPI